MIRKLETVIHAMHSLPALPTFTGTTSTGKAVRVPPIIATQHSSLHLDLYRELQKVGFKSVTSILEFAKKHCTLESYRLPNSLIPKTRAEPVDDDSRTRAVQTMLQKVNPIVSATPKPQLAVTSFTSVRLTRRVANCTESGP